LRYLAALLCGILLLQLGFVQHPSLVLYGENILSSAGTLLTAAVFLAAVAHWLYQRGVDRISLALFIAAGVVSLHYIHISDNAAYTNDVQAYVAHVIFVGEHWLDPYGYVGWGDHHPPLYFYLAAAVALAGHGFAKVSLLTVLRFFSWVAYLGFNAFGLLTLQRAGLKGRGYYACAALLLLWPGGLHMASKISNEPLFYACYAAAFYYAVRWYQEGSPRMLWWAVGLAGLSLMVRGNAVILFVLIALFLGVAWYQGKAYAARLSRWQWASLALWLALCVLIDSGKWLGWGPDQPQFASIMEMNTFTDDGFCRGYQAIDEYLGYGDVYEYPLSHYLSFNYSLMLKQPFNDWAVDEQEYLRTYCNTIPTPEGGTHEAGMRSAILKGFKAYGELIGNKKASQIMSEDALGGAVVILSLFMREPQFQGQTKEKLASTEATRLVENALRDHFDHWLTAQPEAASRLLAYVVDRCEDRLRRKLEKEVGRKAVTQKLRLPGKLADCSRSSRQGTELFIVEGDSAGGSAKQARERESQAVLPLRGKILNVASASLDKIKANQELSDLVLALGCGSGGHFKLDALRYDKIIIMTDADVDGAHIASLLMTFFYQEMPEMIRQGHLYLAQPPLYRITKGTETSYAMDDKAKDVLIAQLSKKSGKIEVGRFKGLGEMTPPQLKETTMNRASRVLLKVMIPDEETDASRDVVERLMGRKPEFRFQFIQEQTAARGKDMIEKLDV